MELYEIIQPGNYSGITRSAWVKPKPHDAYWVILQWGEITTPIAVRVQILQDGIPSSIATRHVTPQNTDTTLAYRLTPPKGTPYRVEVEGNNAIFSAYFPCVESSQMLDYADGWYILAYVGFDEKFEPLSE